VPVAGEELSTDAAAWTFDDQVSQLTVPGGAILWLKNKEACFLRLLADAGTTPLRRSDAVIGIYSRYDDAALHSFDMLLSRLRKKVESHTGGPFPLLTVYGIGYLSRHGERRGAQYKMLNSYRPETGRSPSTMNCFPRRNP
jgi:DNA-binding response OmpR family regulator